MFYQPKSSTEGVHLKERIDVPLSIFVGRFQTMGPMEMVCLYKSLELVMRICKPAKLIAANLY